MLIVFVLTFSCFLCQNILYGAEKSVLFPGLQWGGMTTDDSIFLQPTTHVTDLLANSSYHHDQWRIFSKSGAGFSSIRYAGEILSNAYTCVPQFDENNNAVGGYEFTITVRGTVPDDYDLTRVESKVMAAFEQTVNFIFDNF
jgi:hypothetical protein